MRRHQKFRHFSLVPSRYLLVNVLTKMASATLATSAYDTDTILCGHARRLHSIKSNYTVSLSPCAQVFLVCVSVCVRVRVRVYCDQCSFFGIHTMRRCTVNSEMLGSLGTADF